MAQEKTAGLDHCANKSLHLIGILSEFFVRHGNAAERHFEFTFDIGEQAVAFLFGMACSGTGSGVASMLPANRACSRIGSRPIGMMITSLSGSSPPADSMARVGIHAAGKAAHADLLAAQLRDRFESGRATKVISANLCGK